MFVRDLDWMTAFCCEVFDLQQTDHGKGRSFDFTVALPSGRADPTFDPVADWSARFEPKLRARRGFDAGLAGTHDQLWV